MYQSGPTYMYFWLTEAKWQLFLFFRLATWREQRRPWKQPRLSMLGRSHILCNLHIGIVLGRVADPNPHGSALKSKFWSSRGSKLSRGISQWRVGSSKWSPGGSVDYGGRRFASLWWGAWSGSESAWLWKFGSGSALEWKHGSGCALKWCGTANPWSYLLSKHIEYR